MSETTDVPVTDADRAENKPSKWLAAPLRTIGQCPGVDIGAENGENIAIVLLTDDCTANQCRNRADFIVRQWNGCIDRAAYWSTESASALRVELDRVNRDFDEYLDSLAKYLGLDMDDFNLPAWHGNHRLRRAVLISQRMANQDEIERLSLCLLKQSTREREILDSLHATAVDWHRHASTAALQGEVERLKAELESLNENGAEFCRGLIDEIQALAEERWNGAPAELDTLDRRTIIEIRSHQTGEHGKTRLLLGAAVDIIDKLHGSAVCSRQIMDAAEREREAAVKDRDALQSRVEQLEATWNSTTDDDISVASEKFYNDYPPGSYCSDFAFRAAEIINLYFLRCRDLQSRVAPPVERASVLGEEEIIKEFRELVAQTPTLSPGTDVLLMLKAEKAPELLAAYDRLQAALAESQEAQSSMIEHNRWFADRLDKANAALSQRRPQVVAPVGSYVPTGEIRQPRTGEWAMENGSLSGMTKPSCTTYPKCPKNLRASGLSSS